MKICFGKIGERKNSAIKIELTTDGYEKIDKPIMEIENLIHTGLFNAKNKVSLLQEIMSEVKKLRQALGEVLQLVPTHTAPDNEGDAA